MQQKVYNHTKRQTKIIKDCYQKLLEWGLLKNKYLALEIFKHKQASRDCFYQSKKVDVFAIRFLTESEEDKKGYACTVMCWPL